MSNADNPSDFALRVINWQQLHGRHTLPWQVNQTAYRVWVSEIMLQQTQVNTVIPYYLRFMDSFPNITALATADENHVLEHWAGLGYYSRAKNLQHAAQTVVQEYAGNFPTEYADIVALKGIGRSTAGAILALAYQEKHAILDGNVRRVFARHFALEGWTGAPAMQTKLWQLAEQLLPEHDIRSYTQGLMDLGATLCSRKPQCAECPLKQTCLAQQQNRTQELPSPKPRKVRPEKHCTMTIVLNPAHEVLLYKRPPTGIWNSLWSLPEFSQDIENESIYQELALTAIEQMTLPAFKHDFSHYRLHVQPMVIKTNNVNRVMDANQWLWYKWQSKPTLGMPAPVRRLLESWYQQPK